MKTNFGSFLYAAIISLPIQNRLILLEDLIPPNNWMYNSIIQANQNKRNNPILVIKGNWNNLIAYINVWICLINSMLIILSLKSYLSKIYSQSIPTLFFQFNWNLPIFYFFLIILHFFFHYMFPYYHSRRSFHSEKI